MMKKLVSVLLICVLCLCLAVPAFATNDGFVESPGESGKPCDHGSVELVGKKDPTCTEAGYTGDLVCQECGEVIQAGKNLSMSGHDFHDGICRVCGVSDVPKTGDNSQMMLWAILLVVSAASLTAVICYSRKKA